MNEHIVLRVMVRLLLPFILMYGLYVQFHGEESPGGGFQAGVIFAAGFIVYALAYGLPAAIKMVPIWLVRLLAVLGVVLYTGVGVVGMVLGKNFLDYSLLSAIPADGQRLGVMLVELGVGLTVFSVMLLLFYIFGVRMSEE